MRPIYSLRSIRINYPRVPPLKYRFGIVEMHTLVITKNHKRFDMFGINELISGCFILVVDLVDLQLIGTVRAELVNFQISDAVRTL